MRQGCGQHRRCARLASLLCSSRLRQPASLLHGEEPAVTMRPSPVSMRVLAQLSKFQTPSDLRDELNTGAFDAPPPLAQGLCTEPHSGAIPIPWTAIAVMIQSCRFAIVARVRLTIVRRCRELTAKRLQTDGAPTALRLHSNCKKTARRPQSDCQSTAQFDLNPESALS